MGSHMGAQVPVVLTHGCNRCRRPSARLKASAPRTYTLGTEVPSVDSAGDCTASTVGYVRPVSTG